MGLVAGKLTLKNPRLPEPDMRPEYDFSGAVRSKHHKRYLEGTNVVVLEPDVAKRFKNSASVNEALRSYLKSGKRGLTTRSTRTSRKRAAG
jgi:hypothetical protein